MQFSQNFAISNFIFLCAGGSIFSELTMLQGCVIYHFKGDFMEIQDVLISPYFNMRLMTHFARSGHIGPIHKKLFSAFFFYGKNGK